MYRAGTTHSNNLIAFRPAADPVGCLAAVIELYPLAEIVKLPVAPAPEQRALGWWGEMVPFCTDRPRDDHGGDSAA